MGFLLFIKIAFDELKTSVTIWMLFHWNIKMIYKIFTLSHPPLSVPRRQVGLMTISWNYFSSFRCLQHQDRERDKNNCFSELPANNNWFSELPANNNWFSELPANNNWFSELPANNNWFSELPANNNWFSELPANNNWFSELPANNNWFSELPANNNKDDLGLCCYSYFLCNTR